MYTLRQNVTATELNQTPNFYKLKKKNHITRNRFQLNSTNAIKHR